MICPLFSKCRLWAKYGLNFDFAYYGILIGNQGGRNQLIMEVLSGNDHKMDN